MIPHGQKSGDFGQDFLNHPPLKIEFLHFHCDFFKKYQKTDIFLAFKVQKMRFVGPFPEGPTAFVFLQKNGISGTGRAKKVTKSKKKRSIIF